MNNWDTHEVHFQPAEGLTDNQTAVRVLDHDLSEDERIAEVEERKEMLEEPVDDDNVVEHVLRRQELSELVKADPGYKFLMMVAAFSSRRIGKIINLPKRQGGLYPDPEHISETACEKEAKDDQQWIQQPEVSGLVQLSASVYGHIKEAEMIANNGFVCFAENIDRGPQLCTTVCTSCGVPHVDFELLVCISSDVGRDISAFASRTKYGTKSYTLSF